MERCDRMGKNCSEEDIIQNLKDAGCDDGTIQAFLEHLQSGRQSKGAQLLQKHRRSLLNHLHSDQKRIDCLDYLIFILRKQSRP